MASRLDYWLLGEVDSLFGLSSLLRDDHLSTEMLKSFLVLRNFIRTSFAASFKEIITCIKNLLTSFIRAIGSPFLSLLVENNSSYA